MIGLSEAAGVHSQMLKRPLYQPFLRPLHQAEDAQHHHQPRYGPMLRPLFTEAEHLAGLARVAVAITTVSAFNEGSIDMRGSGRGLQPLLQLLGRAKD